MHDGFPATGSVKGLIGMQGCEANGQYTRLTVPDQRQSPAHLEEAGR